MKFILRLFSYLIAVQAASAGFVVSYQATRISPPPASATPAFDWAEGLPDPTDLAPAGGITRGPATALSYVGWGATFDDSKYVGFKVHAFEGKPVAFTNLIFSTAANASLGLTSYRWGYRVDEGTGFGAWSFSQTYTSSTSNFASGSKVWNFPDFSITGTVEFGLFATAANATAAITAFETVLTLNGPLANVFPPVPTGILGTYGHLVMHPVNVPEVSAVEYNRDTDTLFAIGDEGMALVELSKKGVEIGSMAFDYNRTPREARALDDSEGIAYLGDGRFMLADERRHLGVVTTYQQGGFRTLADLAPTSYPFGPPEGNSGLEGVAYDPRDGAVWGVKETGPARIYRMTGFGTASLAVTQPIHFRYLNRMGVTQLSDVHALAHSAFVKEGDPRRNNLLLLARELKRVIEIDPAGRIMGWLDLSAIGRSTIEGITLDDQGTLYLSAEGNPLSNDPFIRPSALFTFTPPQTPLAVVSEDLAVGSGQVTGTLTWRSEVDARYLIEYAAVPDAPQWEPASEVITAACAFTTGSITPRAQEVRGFFRVRKLAE